MPCSNACKVLTLHRQLQKQPSETPSESNAPSETNTPSETTEARSDRVKEVEEFMQWQVNPALLTASRSSGPAARRVCPSKQDKAEKVQFLSLIFHARTKHNTCTAVVKSSQAPPLPLEVVPEPVPDGNHRPRRARSSRRTRMGADVKAGQDSIFRYFWDF